MATSITRVILRKGISKFLRIGRQYPVVSSHRCKGVFDNGRSFSVVNPNSTQQSLDDDYNVHNRNRYQNPRGQSISFDDEEEDLEYEISEDKLDALRKEHRKTIAAEQAPEISASFSDFPLDERLLKKLGNLGYDQPFDVQQTTLPHTLNGRDLIGRAVTGSGKTLAFSIPIVHKLLQSEGQNIPKNCPRAIVISPTRELCLQIHRSIEELDPRVRCLPVYGGESFNKQENSIRYKGVDVVCATPGRLRDHLERGTLKLDHVEFLCLDEADHLLTPNFLDQIEDVLRDAPSEKQVMLFSATLPPDIKEISRRYMKEPVFVDLTSGGQDKSPKSVKHYCMQVPYRQHAHTVKYLLDEYKPERCIIFITTKAQVRSMTSYLEKGGLSVRALHSDLTQSKRENILSAFRLGDIDLLVATDVAARGLDIPEVDLVIQVEPPMNGVDFYIHRSGRTGRAGRDGMAILIHSDKFQHNSVLTQIGRIVNLEHINPPRYDKLQESTLSKLVETLDKMTDVNMSAAKQILETSEINNEKAIRLLAAALTHINNFAGENTNTYRNKPHRPERNFHQGSNYQGSYNRYSNRSGEQRGNRGNYNDRYKSWKQQRGITEDDI